MTLLRVTVRIFQFGKNTLVNALVNSVSSG